MAAVIAAAVSVAGAGSFVVVWAAIKGGVSPKVVGSYVPQFSQEVA